MPGYDLSVVSDSFRLMLLLLFPVRTDAPIYHFPYATLWLIGLNTIVFVVTWIMPVFFDVGSLVGYTDAICVTLGGSIQPLKWLTANFYHFDPGHLIFNMLFLWTFGLLVEGKLGWERFLAAYLGIGFVGAAAIQATFYTMNGSTWAGGASVAISGLMLMAYLWAPKNDVGIAYFLWVLFFIRLGVFQLSISSFIFIYLCYQAISGYLQGSFLTSEFMHLVGFVLGAILGVWLLRTKRVDCEGWDLFSVMQGKHGRQLKQVVYDDVNSSLGPSALRKQRIKNKKRKARAEREKRQTGETVTKSKMSATDQAAMRIHQLLKKKKARAALQELNERRKVDDSFEIPGPDLLRLAQQLHDLGRSDEAVQFLGEYVDRHPAGSDRVRLTLASLMVKEQTRPTAALRMMEPIEVGDLEPPDRKRHAVLLKTANAMIEDGVIEFGEGAW